MTATPNKSWKKVSGYFLTERNNHLGCRDKLCFLISHVMLCRSQTALGMNLFLRLHFENEPFPDFTRRKNWYETMVFKGDDRFTPITYRAQHKMYIDVFKRVGIHFSKTTHANRKSALNMIAQENVSNDQQKMVSRWGTDPMVGCYISSLPVELMKGLAGFPPHQGSYFLSRAVVIPPKHLQVLVFPDIQFWKEKFDNSDGVQEDTSGPNFLGLLAQLRVVFLQKNKRVL
ncbi:unnamed protein product [Rhizopus microsporus]